MLKLLDKIVFLISILAMTGLCGAYVSSYIDPNVFVAASLLGLAYPYLLISNLLLLLYWIIRWKKVVWAELVIILLGLPTFMTYYGTAGMQQPEQPSDLSLLSYNVRYFDVYNWSNRQDTKEKLFDYLNRFDGSLICLQEFSLPVQSAEEKIPGKLKTFPYRYIYKDMAIFSRLPMINRGYLTFSTRSTATCMYVDVTQGKDTVRIYNVHLESYRMGKKERTFVREISQGIKREDLSDGVKNITIRLTAANKNRARQALQIKKHIRQSPYKVVVCGDFNDTPLSFTYQTLRQGMKDSFSEKGRGLGNTYIGEFPSFRIDYILHSPAFETISYTRDTIQLSDHYPIKSKLRKTN